MNKKEYIKSIRSSMEFFGADTSHLSDEEIEEGTLRMGKAISESGFTLDEALNGITVYNKAIDK